jgi:hypothetical protein
MNYEPPSGWGSDSVSEFISRANQNTYATFVKHPRVFGKLRLINDIFLEVEQHWTKQDDHLSSFFFLRSHAAYLGALRFSLSCQVPEAFLVMRGCLESALYGAFVQGNPARQQIWFDRDKSASARKRMREQFKINKIFEHLETIDPKTCLVARDLYDSTIDYGGHPNRKAILGGIRRKEEGDIVHLGMEVITDDNVFSRLALKRNMQVGLCALMIHRNEHVQRYNLLGLTSRLSRLKRGL